MVDLIFLAAGLGKRAGLGYPKQFARLRGKPLFIHTLEIFKDIEEIHRIFITVHRDFLPDYTGLIEYYNLPQVRLVLGGKTRQESVFNCLDLIETDRVMIHEAARPFVTKELIQELLESDSDIVAPWVEIPFAVFSLELDKGLDKLLLANIQLPQVFNTEKLKEAHQKTHKTCDVDSTLVYETTEATMDLIIGLEENIKITTPLDLKIAEVLLDERYNITHRG